MKCRVIAIIAALSGLTACKDDQRTYEVACAVSPPGLGTGKDGIGHLTPILEITINNAGEIEWAGTPVSAEKLNSYVIQAGKLLPAPQLILNPSVAAPCDPVEQVRTILLKSEICKAGKLSCSEGRNPQQWPMVGGP